MGLRVDRQQLGEYLAFASFRLIAQSVFILRLRGLNGLPLDIPRIVSAAALQRYHVVHDISGKLIILGAIWEDHLGERTCFRSRWSPHLFRPEHSYPRTERYPPNPVAACITVALCGKVAQWTHAA